MKNIYILLFILALFTASTCSEDSPFAPDKMIRAANGKDLYILNRAANQIWLVSGDLQTRKAVVELDAPVTDLSIDEAGKLWAVCEGVEGSLYELDPAGLAVISITKTGYNPTAIKYNPSTKSLWITMRFNSQLWEIDPRTKEVKSRISVGREPVDMTIYGQGTRILVGNNMPEMGALEFPVAAVMSMVDCRRGMVTKTIPLINGSTDVKAIATDAGEEYAYVTHLLSRYQLPTNQVDRGWMCTNALSIIDLKTEELVTTVLLDTPQKGAANPYGVTVSPDNKWLVVAIAGTHELAVIDRPALHQRLEESRQGVKVTPSTKNWDMIPNDAGFLYGIRDFVPTKGKGPRTVLFNEGKIYTANYFTGELLVFTPGQTEAIQSHTFGTPMVATESGKGDMYFHDASLGFQGWQSCASCHPNDARVDGLNWDLLNDGMGNPKNTKPLLLSHETPPCMITGIRKDAETAVRSGLKHILFAKANEEVSKAMDVYLKSLKPLPSPYLVDGQLSEAAEKGKVHFDTYCLYCHSGPYYTDMKQYPVDWADGSSKGVKMDVPALTEVWRTAPYLYDGRSYTMRDMLDVHGPSQPLSDKELDELAEYVLSL